MTTLREDLEQGGYKDHAYIHVRPGPNEGNAFAYVIYGLESYLDRLCSEGPSPTNVKMKAFDVSKGSELPGLSGFMNLGKCLNDRRADETLLEKIRPNI